jgi:hypothetical protein
MRLLPFQLIYVSLKAVGLSVDEWQIDESHTIAPIRVGCKSALRGFGRLFVAFIQAKPPINIWSLRVWLWAVIFLCSIPVLIPDELLHAGYFITKNIEALAKIGGLLHPKHGFIGTTAGIAPWFKVAIVAIFGDPDWLAAILVVRHSLDELVQNGWACASQL